MSARAKKCIEVAKSVLIVLLMLSMTVLFLLTWSTDSASLPDGVRGVVEGVQHFFGRAESPAPVVEGSRAEFYGDAVFPVSAAVSRGGEMRALFAPSGELDELYSSVRTTLGSCISTADSPRRLPPAAVAELLSDSNGIFFRYSGALSCSLLARMLGVEWRGPDSIVLDRLFLSADGQQIALYTISGAECCRFSTSIESSRLAVLGDWSATGEAADWSFELGFSGAPAVFPHGDLYLPTATCSLVTMGEGTVQTLLAAFSMNPETNYRYTSADGTQYAVEEGRVLAISADGTINYADSSAVTPRSMRSDDALVEQCRTLLASASQGMLGDARFGLSSLETSEDGLTIVRFGYTLGSLPVYIGSARDSAVFVFAGGALKEARVMLRRCSFDGGSVLMLPPASAAAIGSEGLCYYDVPSGDALVADWTR